jgi:thymidylate synthase
MNNIDKRYTDLLQDILDNGVKKQTRNGEVLSVFGRQIRHKMSDGFPLLTTKKMPFKTMVTELLWFLRGDTNIKYLVDNNCHIWDGDCYNFYLKQFEVDPNNFDAEELVKGHSDQCWGYPILDHVKPTSKEYKRGQINAFLEGKAERPFFYLTQEEFISKIKTDDEFAKKWGELGPVYGKQWRSWGRVTYNDEHRSGFYNPIDQIANLINELKTNPDSRRLMVSAWNCSDLGQMVLPPCHYGFQVYTRELSLEERCDYDAKKDNVRNTYDQALVTFGSKDVKKWLDEKNIPTRAISLMWNQRSVDTFLGLPFNIASYGLLLTMIADEVNMVPDELIGNLGDVHLYSNHIEQAKEQINREPFELPKLNIKLHFKNEPSFVPEHWLIDDFELEKYQSHPTIKAPLSN